MKRHRLLAPAIVVLVTLLNAGAVSADSVYHSERLALTAVDGAAGTGMVVNVHPNGPRNFAQERYSLSGADAHSTYSVWLVIDASALACDFESLTIAMKAELRTNAAGNGTSPADFVFRPEGIPPCLRNASFPIHWDVTQDNELTHQTESITVTLD